MDIEDDEARLDNETSGPAWIDSASGHVTRSGNVTTSSTASVESIARRNSHPNWGTTSQTWLVHCSTFPLSQA